MSRADEIAAEVLARTHIWDCFDQGRWARACGVLQSANPHGPYYPGYFHTNMAEWTRGWQAENDRSVTQ